MTKSNPEIQEQGPRLILQEVEAAISSNPEIIGLQSYEYFRSNAADLKEQFIDGELSDLTLFYPDLTSSAYMSSAEDSLEVLKRLMGREAAGDPKTTAFFAATEYRYAELSLLHLAAQLNNPDLPEESKAEVVNWFQETNEALYGRPEYSMFHALANETINPLLEAQYPEESVEATLQTDLKGLLGEIHTSEKKPFRPEVETVERIRSLVLDRFSVLIDHIDDDKTYSIEDMVGAIDVALEKIGGKELGWRADIAKNSSALAISAHQRLAEVGERRKPLVGSELKAKVLHEVGVHALRSVNAEKANWLSAAYGQDGYLAFEEALATAMEDAYKGEFVDHGVNYYLIAGLAYGDDDHEPRNFREVYEIMWRTNALSAKGHESIADDEVKAAKARAFNNCLRMFRGTRTTDKGVIYSKDLAYFVGQELAWEELDKVHTQSDLDLLLAGKLDITRDDHRNIAEAILVTS